MPGVYLEVPNSKTRPSADKVSRNDSFRSERSDKKVSFNNDVGVKRIPRGQKQQPTPQHSSSPKNAKDEWANCAQVHLETPRFSSKELERQAEDLVRLIDQVDCISGTQPVSHHSKDRAQVNNNKNTRAKDNNINSLNNSGSTFRKNNLLNGLDSASRNSSQKLDNYHTKNSIRSPAKENINVYRRDHSKNPIEQRPFMRRSVSAHPSDVNDSDTDHTYEKYSATYKSVPDIPTTIHYDNYNKPYERYQNLINHDIGESKNFVSVDNIYNDRKNKLRERGNEYKSVDNLTDVSIPGNRKLHEYKSVENLQSGYSSSTNEFDNTYQPKVGHIIKKLNSGVEEQRERVQTIMHEDRNPRGYREPDAFHSHNSNKPFSYTGVPLSSVDAVRRLSPSREQPPFNSNDVYAKVNKNEAKIIRTISRENERNLRNPEEDFSAKIIITNDSYPSRYDGDDDAYETYQVGGNNFSKQYKEYGYSNENLLNEYKYDSNNMNMSSVGVQTDGQPRIPARARKQEGSPTRYQYGAKESFNNDLSSASLVRRINHGFGKMDRSPSPPPRVVASHRKMPRNVVPLLSDTDDSEFNYKGRSDPMARIRDQVKIREKLFEEREAEEREAREDVMYQKRIKSLDELDSRQRQPLETEKRGRNSLIAARQGYSNSTSRISNDYHHSRKAESNINRIQSVPPRGRKSSPEGYSRDKSQSPRPMSTLERMKKTIEKGKSSLDRSDPNVKEKKKKKIKIKFFYDPKVQEGASKEDPLNKYTEYKGTSSDERSSPYEDYYRGSRNEIRDDFHRTLLHDNYTDKRDYLQRRDKSEERNPVRPPRAPSRDTSRDSKERERSRGNRYDRESSNERYRESRESKDSRDSRIQAANRGIHYSDSSIDRREPTQRKPLRENFRNDQDFVDGYRKRESSSLQTREEANFKKYEHTTGNRHYDNRNENSDRSITQTDNRYNKDGRTTPERGVSLSEKYRSLTRHSTPPRERSIVRGDTPTKPKGPLYTEDKVKQEKILRQRKKFFGVLLGEGRGKGKPLPGKGESSTLPRTTPQKVTTSTNTLQRIDIPESPKNSPIRREKKEIPVVENFKQGLEGHHYTGRDREADSREKRHWESATLDKPERRGRPAAVVNKATPILKYSGDSSPSSTATPVGRVGRTTSFKQRYFGDTDAESGRVNVAFDGGDGDYRSLPTRKNRGGGRGARLNVPAPRRGIGMRGISPGARGSAGSSLQSSESEADSHGGSHASRQSRASHVSTGSNRSVYLHATAVADIPVRRSSDESPSEKGVSRQSKKVSRSFSLLSPWKPRHYRERYEVEYDNREVRDARQGKGSGGKSALPPRPPRKQTDFNDTKKVGRSQTLYKDSKLTGWLKRKRNKDVKGI